MSLESANAGGSLQFDLCRRDHRQAFVIGLDDSGEFHGFGFPALVDKFSRERRLSTEFPNDPVLIREISGWHGDLGTFRSLGDGNDLEMLMQTLPASLGNTPRSRHDRRGVRPGKYFHQEIH